jgi:hypothetical protein
MFCFFVLRHVNNAITNEYWQESCAKINQYYPTKHIIIIDDNSNCEFLNQTRELKNVTVINSEFTKGKGELLPYYYFHKLKQESKITETHAIMFHDSIFLNSNMFSNDNLPTNVKFLWHTQKHGSDNKPIECDFLGKLTNNNSVLNLYNNKRQWNICFGVMSVISYTFLDKLNNKYNFFNTMIPLINTRDDRMRLERIFGVLCMTEDSSLLVDKSYMGDICSCKYWGYSWDDYKKGIPENPLIKVFTGR